MVALMVLAGVEILLAVMVPLALFSVPSVRRPPTLERTPEDSLPGISAILGKLGIDWVQIEAYGWREVLHAITALIRRESAHAYQELSDAVHVVDVIDLIDAFGDYVTDVLSRATARTKVRFYLDTLDLLLALVRGTIRERLLVRGFDAINDRDLAEWLRDNGADLEPDPLQWPALLRAVYSGCFAFADGDPKQPRMAAGRAIQGTARCLFFYGPDRFSTRLGGGAPASGSVLYRMQAGMGDTVIAPLYEALRARGVEFRFFTAVAEVRPDGTGQRIAALELVNQVALTSPYGNPLMEINGPDGRKVTVWPTEPPWAQIANGATLAATARAAHRLEQEIDPFPDESTSETITLADDDQVVLAVPPDVQREICAGLRVDPAYAAMLDASATVMTQALQIWIDQSPQDLGQGFSSNSLMSTYVEPWDTYCDMSHLLDFEDGGPHVRHLAYFCGVLASAGLQDQAQADRAARQSAEAFLRDDAPLLWPGTAAAGRPPFGPAMLVPRPGRPWTGRQSASPWGGLRDQYLRANWAPTERYTLSLPNSIERRLGAKGTRFGNLVLAGDWTINGLDAGCVEAAVTSGMLAANALYGAPEISHIQGLNGPPGFPNRWDRLTTPAPRRLPGVIAAPVAVVTSTIRRTVARSRLIIRRARALLHFPRP